jgi:hypothetical protein
MAVFALLAACGDSAPSSPATLELLADTPPVAIDFAQFAYDANNSLVCADGNIGLHRLDGNVFQHIPGTEQFAFAAFGVDRDGSLLVGGNGTATLAKLPATNVLEQIGPFLPESATSPIGTPAGNYYLRVTTRLASLMFAPAATAWVESPLDLGRALYAPDNTLYAIVDGDIVRFAADDTMTPVGDCTQFGGGACGSLQLGGFDDRGDLYMGARGAGSLQVLEPGGAIRDLDLPGNLVVSEVRAGTDVAALVAADPDRNNELSLWFVAGDEFQRVTTLGGLGVRLLADHAGAFAVVKENRLFSVIRR